MTVNFGRAAAITTPEPAWAQRAAKVREWQSWCAALEDDVRDRFDTTEVEVAEHFASLSRIRTATMFFASLVAEEASNLKMVSTPYHPEDILKHIQEIVGEVLGLTSEASHVLSDDQQ